jgi:hypothetical protein
MGGKAVICRKLHAKGVGDGQRATGVLLDCAMLGTRRWDERIDAMFGGRLDDKRWILLADEPQDTVGELPDAATRLLHMTEGLTQPCKPGMPIDFNMILQGPGGRFQPHPVPRQSFFFSLVKKCLASGRFSEDFLRRAVAAHHVRPDVFQRIAAACDCKPLAS